MLAFAMVYSGPGSYSALFPQRLAKRSDVLWQRWF